MNLLMSTYVFFFFCCSLLWLTLLQPSNFFLGYVQRNLHFENCSNVHSDHGFCFFIPMMVHYKNLVWVNYMTFFWVMLTSKTWFSPLSEAARVLNSNSLLSFSSDKDRRTDSRIRRSRKTQRSPTGNRTQGLVNSSRTFFFRLIRLSTLLFLSELKEKRFWLEMIPTRASWRMSSILNFF